MKLIKIFWIIFVLFLMPCTITYAIYKTNRNKNEALYVQLENIVQSKLEEAYFEGQKDALNGDIRIKYLQEDSCWVWIKSPWNSGKSPIFNPLFKNK